MSTAQPASTCIASEVLQIVGIEDLVLLVVTALLAVTFRGARLGKQTRSSKSPETLNLKPQHAEQAGSSKSAEALALERGDVTLTQMVTHERCQKLHHAEQIGSAEALKLERGDVTLTQMVTHERCQSGLRGAWGEEQAQNSQQMPPSLSGSSGEEPAKMSSRQRWREKKKLEKNTSTVSSGDPIKDTLVLMIKSLQQSRGQAFPWGAFCESQEVKNRDPARYPVHVLHQFVVTHCFSVLPIQQGRSEYLACFSQRSGELSLRNRHMQGLAMG